MNNPDSKGIYTDMKDTAIYLVARTPSEEQYKYASDKYQLKGYDDIYEKDGSPIGSREVYYQISKFDDLTRPSTSTVESARDHFVFRIAEMYLIVAEGYMDSDPATAVKYMNILREVHAIKRYEAEMDITAADLNIDFILDERARELFGEELRWFDLKRTGKLEERVKAHNPDAAPNTSVNDSVRPFPQDFLDAIQNKEDFPQKPGYN